MWRWCFHTRNVSDRSDRLPFPSYTTPRYNPVPTTCHLSTPVLWGLQISCRVIHLVLSVRTVIDGSSYTPTKGVLNAGESGHFLCLSRSLSSRLSLLLAMTSRTLYFAFAKQSHSSGLLYRAFLIGVFWTQIFWLRRATVLCPSHPRILPSFSLVSTRVKHWRLDTTLVGGLPHVLQRQGKIKR